MKLKEIAMIRSLMVHFGQDLSILRYLDPKVSARIKLLEPPGHLNFPSILSPTKWLLHVHYSWFYPYLSTLPAKTVSLFFPLFSQPQRKGLESMLKMEVEPKPLAPFVTYFLANHLQKQVQKEDVIPFEALPQGNLNPLIRIKWSQLMLVIDTLGLYDLACDFKQVVDKQLMKKIYRSLTKEQGEFLTYATKQPMKWSSPSLNLQNWDGDAEKLQSILHQRGLMRLAKGILLEHLSFRWHLIHRLDVGRAKVMNNALSMPVDSGLIPYFRAQILTIANRVCS